MRAQFTYNKIVLYNALKVNNNNNNNSDNNSNNNTYF